jgi:protein TonB
MPILIALALAAVPASPPVQRGGYVTQDDYPRAALRAGAAGTTAVHLTISAQGRVSECQVTRSAGFDALDKASCDLMLKRARFSPALDKDGKPVEGGYDTHVSWRLPE